MNDSSKASLVYPYMALVLGPKRGGKIALVKLVPGSRSMRRESSYFLNAEPLLQVMMLRRDLMKFRTFYRLRRQR